MLPFAFCVAAFFAYWMVWLCSRCVRAWLRRRDAAKGGGYCRCANCGRWFDADGRPVSRPLVQGFMKRYTELVCADCARVHEEVAKHGDEDSFAD